MLVEAQHVRQVLQTASADFQGALTSLSSQREHPEHVATVSYQMCLLASMLLVAGSSAYREKGRGIERRCLTGSSCCSSSGTTGRDERGFYLWSHP